jgi:hypothetical protein
VIAAPDDATDLARQLGTTPERISRLHEPTGEPDRALPALADAPEILDRIAVRPADAAEILAGWPEPDSPHWTPALRWLLPRVVATIRADLGGYRWLVPGPELPRDRGPAWKHFYVYAYLALLDDVLGYHAGRGIPQDVSWETLGDIGRKLDVDRQMRFQGWPVLQQWLTLHVRGGIYELGRLQHQRGDGTVDLHIAESGPLTPAAVDASLARAREFFPRHFPEERYEWFACGSWLLDPQLAEYLPEDSNIVRFQRRFELDPPREETDDEGGSGDEDVLRFVFQTLDTQIDRLPRRTTLQRAIVTHLNTGRHWAVRHGRLPF